MSDIDDAWSTVQAKLKEFADALDDFKTVEVRTMITEMEWMTETDAGGAKKVVGIQPSTDPSATPKGLVTTIDMMKGDITHDSSPALSDRELARLQKAHAEHVEIGRKIFTDNMRFIAETVERFARGPEAAE